MSSKTNPILAVSAESILASLPSRATDFIPMDSGDLFRFLQSAPAWMGPRNLLEKDASFLQLIPYVVLRVGTRFVRYTRTASGGEAGLHNKVSIGLGGHVDMDDVLLTDDNHIDIRATLAGAASREVNEEVTLPFGGAPIRRWVGLVVDRDTDVGLVHLGVVAVWDIESEPTTAEECIADVSLASLAELRDTQLETWSGLVVDWLSNNPAF